MRLDEGIHAEIARACLEATGSLVVEVAKQQEHGVGAGGAQLHELVVSREEPLREQRQPDRGSRGPQVVDAAAEALVDEHRDRGSARPLECRGERGGIGIGPQLARRWRTALHLGDGGEARSGECVSKPHV